jgi:hypothetical protein
MSDPQDRLGVFLPGMSWFSAVEKESRLVARKRQAGRQTAKVIASPQTIVQLIVRNFPRLLCFGTADCADRSAQSV